MRVSATSSTASAQRLRPGVRRAYAREAPLRSTACTASGAPLRDAEASRSQSSASRSPRSNTPRADGVRRGALPRRPHGASPRLLLGGSSSARSSTVACVSCRRLRPLLLGELKQLQPRAPSRSPATAASTQPSTCSRSRSPSSPASQPASRASPEGEPSAGPSARALDALRPQPMRDRCHGVARRSARAGSARRSSEGPRGGRR